MKQPFEDDFVQVALSAHEMRELLRALEEHCAYFDRNRAIARRMDRQRLADQYTIWMHTARAVQETCRLAYQSAEDAAELTPDRRHTPASGPKRTTPELVASARHVPKALIMEFYKRFGELGVGPMPPVDAARAAQKELELLEPEGRC